MNHYTFDEIEIGWSEKFTEKITSGKMNMFAEISGDYNPMHIDADYAKSKGYKDKIVYGMLASSLYSTLVGMYLPGEKCILNKCNVNYKEPVYIDDILTVSGKVTDKRLATRRIKITGETINQHGIVVNSAEIIVSFTKD